MVTSVEKKWYKKWWVWILIFFGIIFLAGLLSPSEPSTKTGTITESGKESAKVAESAETAKETIKEETKVAETIYNLGDTITIEGMEYVVDKEVFALPIIGSDYVQKQADGTFMIFSVIIKNNGKSEVFLTSNSFKLKDSQGRKYNADTGASMYLSTIGLEGLVFKTLGAGLSTSGNIVFDVPTDDTGLVLEITGEGIFAGTKSVKIGDVSDFT